jgi:hypothetical protein
VPLVRLRAGLALGSRTWLRCPKLVHRAVHDICGQFCPAALNTHKHPFCLDSTGRCRNSSFECRQPDYLTTSDLSWLTPDGILVFDGSFNGVSGGGMFAFSLDDGASNGIGIYKINGSGALTAYLGGLTGQARPPVHRSMAAHRSPSRTLGP